MLLIKNKSGKTKTFITGSLLVVGVLVLTGGFNLFKNAQAFPTGTAVLDNFNRANTGSIAGQTTSHGETWAATQTINGASPATLGITSNQLNRAGNANNAYIDTIYGPDSEVYTDVPVLPGNTEYVALWARIQSPGSSGFSSYALVYTHSTSGNASWALLRFSSGSLSTLSTISAPALLAGNGLGLEVTGTGGTVTLTAYQKSGSTWSTIGSVNDTAGNRITAAGYIGVEIGENTARLDNFGGGTIVQNTVPSAPTLSLPTDNVTGVSTTPQFQLRSTDADSDDLQYKIEVCQDAACSTVLRTIDQTSSQVGWSGQDKLSSTAYTGSPTLTSSTLAVHNYQAPALSNSTQYWWRAYAIDPNGANAFSLASSIFSFTTEAAASSGGSSSSGSGSTGSTSTSTLDPNLTPPTDATWGK